MKGKEKPRGKGNKSIGPARSTSFPTIAAFAVPIDGRQPSTDGRTDALLRPVAASASARDDVTGHHHHHHRQRVATDASSDGGELASCQRHAGEDGERSAPSAGRP